MEASRLMLACTEFTKHFETAKKREAQMRTTIIEIEFVELPVTPEIFGDKSGEIAAAGNGYLLSMWDTSCRIAKWCAKQQAFEDSGGLLNRAAIRSWAALPQPLDRPCWGQPIIEAALSRDDGRPNAGWLEPIYET